MDRLALPVGAANAGRRTAPRNRSCGGQSCRQDQRVGAVAGPVQALDLDGLEPARSTVERCAMGPAGLPAEQGQSSIQNPVPTTPDSWSGAGSWTQRLARANKL